MLGHAVRGLPAIGRPLLLTREDRIPGGILRRGRSLLPLDPATLVPRRLDGRVVVRDELLGCRRPRVGRQGLELGGASRLARLLRPRPGRERRVGLRLDLASGTGARGRRRPRGFDRWLRRRRLRQLRGRRRRRRRLWLASRLSDLRIADAIGRRSSRLALPGLLAEIGLVDGEPGANVRAHALRPIVALADRLPRHLEPAGVGVLRSGGGFVGEPEIGCWNLLSRNLSPCGQLAVSIYSCHRRAIMTSEADVIEGMAVDAEPAGAYLARLSPGAATRMERALDTVARLLGEPSWRAVPWARLRYRDVAALRSRLVAKFAPGTVNLHLSAVRSTLREGLRLGLIGAAEYEAARSIEPVRSEALPVGRSLRAPEVQALFLAAAQDEHLAARRRNEALLVLLLGCALRREEVVSLALQDFEPFDGRIIVRASKNGKSRVVPVPASGKPALLAYLELRGTEPGALLCPVNRGGRLTVRRMTAVAVFRTLHRLADRAGVASFSPHTCRRTAATTMLDRGSEVVVVAGILGHSSVSTTSARYDTRREVRKQHAADSLMLPLAT